MVNKIYTIAVEHKYGVREVYDIKAKNHSEARKKAKAKYIKRLFKENLLSTHILDKRYQY